MTAGPTAHGKRRRRAELLRAAAASALAVAVFANVLRAGFVWDDSAVVQENPFVGNPRYLSSIFSPSYFTLFSEFSYRPVVTLTYFADAALWGKNPLGYHLTNVLLHAVATLLFYGVASGLLESRRGGFIAALIFAVHPIHTEAVDAVFAREDVLCALFYFAAVSLFLAAARGSGPRASRLLAVSALSFLMALFSKEMALSFPLLVLALSFLPPLSRRGPRPFAALRAACLYGAALAAYIAVRFFLLQNPAETAGTLEPANLLLAPGAAVTYLRLVLVPVGLCADRLPPDPSWTGAAISLLVLAAAAALAARVGRRVPAVLTAAAWFLITVLPVSHLFPLQDPLAERFLYLPSAGACLLMALPARARGRSRTAWAAALIVLFSFMTVRRNRVWKDGLSLWTETAARSPLSAAAQNNLGLALAREGRTDEAIRRIERAVELSPGDPEFLANLGSLHAMTGSYGAAEARLREAVRLSPASASAHYNLGRLYGITGHPRAAAAEYGAALRIKPWHLSARNNLGALYAARGEYARAREEWERVLLLDPSNTRAAKNLRTLASIGGGRRGRE